MRLDFSARPLRPGRLAPAGSCPGVLSSGTVEASCGSSTETGLGSAGSGPATAGFLRAGWEAFCVAIRLFGFGRRQPSSSASYRARYRRSLRIRRSCDVPRSIGGVSESVRTATTEATTLTIFETFDTRPSKLQ